MGISGALRISDTTIFRSRLASPPPPFRRAEEIPHIAIEGGRLFQVDGVAAIRANPKSRVRKRFLEPESGFKTRLVLIACDQQYRDLQEREFVLKVLQRGTPGLIACQRPRLAFG